MPPEHDLTPKPADFPTVIAAMPANDRQRKIAFGTFITMVGLLAIALPFANMRLVRIDGFVPAAQSVMCAASLLTAALLFAQYRAYPHRALLALASGYAFSGLFAFLQTCAFPGAFGPGVLIGDELSSAGWLFVFWQTVFPLAVIAYTLSKDAGTVGAEAAGQSPGTMIAGTIACVVAATAGLTWLATAGVGYLPSIYQSPGILTPFAMHLAPFLLLLNVATLVLLFVRRHTILDQWLIIALLAWVPTFAVAALFLTVRFTVAWYLARVFALFAGSALLFVLLAETLVFYTRLANAYVMLRRAGERQKVLVAELDHRVKNVLARVVAVAKSTRQHSDSADEFVRALEGRIQSMAAAHALLSQSGWQGVGVDALVRNQLAPYATGANLTIDGTEIVLTPAATQAVAMVLHELVTNSAKYGALSAPDGKISVTWDRRVGEDGAARMVLAWRGRGGPPVTPPAHFGYGIDLIRELIPHELGGKVDLVFAPEGVRCDIEMPLDDTARELSIGRNPWT